MIDDSGPWKCELMRVCQELLDSFASPDLFPGASVDVEAQQVFLVERAAFLTALTVRKLGEAGKISVQFLSKSIPYMRHGIIDPDRRPDKLNMHRSPDFYKEAGKKASLSYLDFANMLIHSRVFVALAGEDADGRILAEGFAIASDRTLGSHLSVFSVSDLALYVQKLAEDEIVQAQLVRDSRGGWVSVGSNKILTETEFEWGVSFLE